MPTPVRTERQLREQAFYREYVSRQRVEAVDFSPVEGNERRPWNPYWYVFQTLRTRYVGPWQRLLDFGCGVGIASVRLAHLGYQVDGFDISPENCNAASELSRTYGLGDRCEFKPMAAEELEYKNKAFDLVAGIDILHHVDIPRAVAEAHRVLKPGGVAIFKEHTEVPVIDPLRNTRLMRAVAPTEESLDHHITADERKLNAEDLAVIRRQFSRVDTARFTLLSRIDRLIPNCSDAIRTKLQRLDHRVLQLCPPLAGLGGTVVLICQK